MVRDLVAFVADDLFTVYAVCFAVGDICCHDVVIFIDDNKTIVCGINDALQVNRYTVSIWHGDYPSCQNGRNFSEYNLFIKMNQYVTLLYMAVTNMTQGVGWQ